MASTRQMTLAALRAAKTELSDGSLSSHGQADYICWAIGDGVFAQDLSIKSEGLAIRLIQERLGHHAYVDSWLRSNVPGAAEFLDQQPHPSFKRRIVQEYRHRWLDALIEEFGG